MDIFVVLDFNNNIYYFFPLARVIKNYNCLYFLMEFVEGVFSKYLLKGEEAPNQDLFRYLAIMITKYLILKEITFSVVYVPDYSLYIKQTID